MALLRPLRIEHLGIVPYALGQEIQEKRRAEVLGQTMDDTLFLLEHTPVITTGRNAGLTHLRSTPAQLAAQGVDLVVTDRGGDVTYHGPGQLVGYPVVALQSDEQDLRGYVWRLEEIIIRTAADFGVSAMRVDKLRGVWVGNDKLAAIGIRLAHWVTSHGFALNVHPDMGGFAHIVPCGLVGRGVTSLAQLCRPAPTLRCVEAAIIKHSAEIFNRTAYDAHLCAQSRLEKSPAYERGVYG